MNSMGTVRRIDNAGRVVIPMEIRKALRIWEGDAMEIMAKRSGEIVIRKYNPAIDVSDIAKAYADSLHLMLGYAAIICDTQQVVAASGSDARMDYLNRQIDEEILRAMQDKMTLIADFRSEMMPVPVLRGELVEYTSQVISPIFTQAGEVVGAVILLSYDPRVSMSELESRAVQAVCRSISRRLEAYEEAEAVPASFEKLYYG